MTERLAEVKRFTYVITVTVQATDADDARKQLADTISDDDLMYQWAVAEGMSGLVSYEITEAKS